MSHPNITFTFYRNDASEPFNRVATDDYRQELDYIPNRVYRSGTTSLAALGENYITFHSGVAFKPYSPNFETFNDVKIWFESNGIMEKWRWDTHYLSKKSDKLGPQVLTMDHLRIGFLTCLVPLTISIAVFIAESVCSKVVIAIKKYFHKTLKSECKSFLNFLRYLELKTCNESYVVGSDHQSCIQNNFDDIDGIYSIGEIDDIDKWVARCHFKRHVK